VNDPASKKTRQVDVVAFAVGDEAAQSGEIRLLTPADHYAGIRLPTGTF
jgi:hypothetical protein